MEIFIAALIFAGMIFAATALIGAPYVPTHKKEAVFAFTELYQLKNTDLVVDIGSGDGVVLATVGELGARGVGYEINPFLVSISRWRLRRFKDSLTVYLRNFWKTPLPDDTTIVYTFGESRDIKKMYKYVEQEATRLQKKIAFISYGFAVPGIVANESKRAHYLYQITPLQPQ